MISSVSTIHLSDGAYPHLAPVKGDSGRFMLSFAEGSQHVQVYGTLREISQLVMALARLVKAQDDWPACEEPTDVDECAGSSLPAEDQQ